MTIIVTGATSGIGLATATRLAGEGSDVTIVGRSEQSTAEAAAAVRSAAHRDARVDADTADLGRIDEVRDLAERVAADHADISGLVLCAAVASPPVPVVDGVDTTLAVNHLAPVLLSQRLDGAMQGGRIILVGSSRHGSAGPFDPGVFAPDAGSRRQYEMTKLLNLLYAMARVSRPHATPLEVIDPGFVRTGLGRNARGLFSVLLKVSRPIQTDPARPARAIAERLRATDFTDGGYRGLRGPAERAPNVTAESAQAAWEWTQDLLG